MRSKKLIKSLIAVFATFTLSIMSQWVSAETIKVAVASNFSLTLQEIVTQFEKETGHTVKLSSASTGKLYAQIINGAPFDIFLAADSYRPELLAQERMRGEQVKTYAYGRLIFLAYINKQAIDNEEACINQISAPSVKRIAIANPVTAPYGFAAKNALESLGLWRKVEDKIVMGENIAQTLHFVDSQNAQAGFVAKSQLFKHDVKDTCQWDVPGQYHKKIEQKMIKLKAHKQSPAVDAFWAFISGPQAQKIIMDYGYDVPGRNE